MSVMVHKDMTIKFGFLKKFQAFQGSRFAFNSLEKSEQSWEYLKLLDNLCIT